ncbi:MAG: hypothetical protein WC858_06375 [Parcubacteria group bacterium]
MKRSYLIISITIIIAIVITAVLLLTKYFGSRNKTAGDQAPANKSQEMISLPVTSYQGQDLQVEDRNNQVQIRNSFEAYIKQNSDNSPLYKENGISQAFPIDDKNGEMIQLDSFLESVGAKVNPKIKSLVGSSYYGFFYCPKGTDNKDFGMTLDLASDSQNLGSVNSQAINAMLQWEPFMLKDLHNILFPGINFNDTQISQPLVFKDGKFRYAEVNLPGGEKSSINYAVDIYPPDHPSAVNKVFIATSQECLEKSLGYLFDF